MESGNSEDRARMWGLEPQLLGGGKTVEQVGREEQDLLSEKLNVRCLWSSTWKWQWEGSCWIAESGVRDKGLAGS